MSLAFGLAVLSMAYALGHVSGGHFNPAVTVGRLLGKRFEAREAMPYVAAQVAAAVVAAAVLYLIASGRSASPPPTASRPTAMAPTPPAATGRVPRCSPRS